MQYHHIFFHSLIYDSKRCFSVTEKSKHNFELWMITVNEYKKILESLYERGYVLVNMKDLLNGKINLPTGKTPLVMSFDDVNYYDYMKNIGMPEKIVLKGNKLANQYTETTGEIKILEEIEHISILEKFIEKHPDFSYQNARPILAVTGYEGLLGYKDLINDKESLIDVITKLKSLGYEFACHSYSHSSEIFKTDDLDEQKCIEDTKMWQEKLENILGKTDIYISPFGIPVQNYPKYRKALKKMGFKYICEVDNKRTFIKKEGLYYFPRVNIDGFIFLNRTYEFDYYYGDVSKIYDKNRKTEFKKYSNDNISLVKHAFNCLTFPTIYLWGGIGEVITSEVIDILKNRYPNVYTKEYISKLKKCIGKNVRGFDCSGLIKNYMMGGLIEYKYDNRIDMNSEMMLEKSIKKGTIDTLPEVRGICLYMPGHVGIYVGNGFVIESTSNKKFGDGVCKTKISDRKWTHWFYCPTITYED